jgi:hypothetical protein
MNEVAALPIAGGSVVRSAPTVLRPHPPPCRLPAHFPVDAGYRAGPLRSPPQGLPGRQGLLQFLSLPSERSAPHTPRSTSGLLLQALHPFHGLRPDHPGSALPKPITTRQVSLHATDRPFAPPKGLSTLGFDRNRFQSQPPVCYRAPWRLPGPDSHRLATTSFGWLMSSHLTPPALWTHVG